VAEQHAAWENLVAVIGTTISPYLFFWQTSQEVEEEKAIGRQLLRERQGATKREIIDRRIDVGTGVGPLIPKSSAQPVKKRHLGGF
jgi:Mn2+/Fe2+ NRAMP family transporter